MEGNQKYSLNPWKLWLAGETMDEAVNASAGHAQRSAALPRFLPNFPNPSSFILKHFPRRPWVLTIFGA